MLRALVVVVLVSTFAARAQADCDNAHYVRSFDAALTPGTCRQIGSAGFGSVNARIVHLRPAGTADTGRPPADEAQAIADLQTIASGVAGSATTFDMPLPPRITILLDPRELGPENRVGTLHERAAAKAAHPQAIEDDECTVAYHYRSADSRKLFFVAHEIFHCMVLAAWDDSLIDHGDADWWAEGSAEFFASTVVGGGTTDLDATTFQSNESASLFSRAHDACLFFDWYISSANKLKELLDSVHDKTGGEFGHELQDDVGDHWVEFEEAYFDHTIHEPSGHVLAYPQSHPDTTRFSSTRTQSFTGTPYVVRGAILEFAEGHAYELSGADEADFHWQWTLQPTTGGWADRPDVVHTCHQLKRYRVVIAGGDHEVAARLRVHARDEHERDCPCLVGTWAQTGDSLSRVASRGPMAAMHRATCSVQGGGMQMTVAADGTGADTYQGFVVQCVGPTMRSTSTANGALRFTWTSEGHNFSFADAGGDAAQDIVVDAHGHAVSEHVAIPGGSATVTFTCTPTTLHIDYPDPAMGSFDYTRVGAAP